MNPWLYYGDEVRLPAYFTLLMVGFALATFVVRREARREGLPSRDALDTMLIAVPLVLLGGRMAHIVFVEPDFYWNNPWETLQIDNGGFVFYGGLAIGALTVTLRARRLDIDPWAMGDVFAPAVAFGLIFGRLGCLGGGCCYGKIATWPFGWEVPWAIRYYRRNQVPEELMAVPVHPAPLYAAFFGLALWAYLSWRRSRQRVPGQTMLEFVMWYGLGRTALEAFRADISRGLYLGEWVSTSQFIGIGSALIAGIVLWARITSRES